MNELPWRARLDTALLWGAFVGAAPAVGALSVLRALLRGEPLGRAWRRWPHWQGRLFFSVIRALRGGAALVETELAGDLSSLRGAMVVCNHRSFLDPVLLFSHLPDAVTVVRTDLMRLPLFGTVLAAGGSVPASELGRDARALERLRSVLDTGAVAFVFPEGTRRGDPTRPRLRKGAFHIARELGLPIEVLHLDGSERVYPADSRWLRLHVDEPLRLRRIGRLSAAEVAEAGSSRELAQRIERLFTEAAERQRSAPRAGSAGGRAPRTPPLPPSPR